MSFDFDYLLTQWPALLDGLWMTLQVSALSIVLSLLIGVLGAGIRLFRLPLLAQLVALYLALARDSPRLGRWCLISYRLRAVGMRLSVYWSAGLSLSLWAGASPTETLRGGVATSDKGLREAGMALNLQSR